MVTYVRLNIDGKPVKVPKGASILDAAREAGVEIPTLCDSPYLKPYGSCGLCVVEVAGNPKLLRSCSTEASDGMVVMTDSQRVVSSRKTALELLLSDHYGDCKAPCVMACPTNCDAQGYIALIANGRIREAVGLIKETLPIPASIGRVCPHPCEDACRRSLVDEPMSICALKRYAADADMAGEPYLPEKKPPTNFKVAIVGSGPAGLSAGYFLSLLGHDVTIFESLPDAGGMLRYGIPEYRLPKKVLQSEIDLIRRVGVQIFTGKSLGKDFTVSDLKHMGFDAIFLALGAQKSRGLGVPGEDSARVLGGVEFLREVALGKTPEIGKDVAVIGGGNTAMDAARTAIRLGAKKVWVVYRRSRSEMPARDQEVVEAEEEGVSFMFLTAPVSVTSNGDGLAILTCQKMSLGEPDASGRRRPVPVAGSEFTLTVNTVISAIGQQGDLSGLDGEVKTERNGVIIADEHTLQTSMPGVFAGGDVVTGPGIAVEAVAQGKRAAQTIDRYLRGLSLESGSVFNSTRGDMSPEDFKDKPKQARANEPVLSPEGRKGSFVEIASTLTHEQALKEAQRCLECGCQAVFNCKLRRYASDYGVTGQKYSGSTHKYPLNTYEYIVQDPNKCILCGQCVRVCEEVRGIGALGFVNRGFDTVIRPAFELPLPETACDWCGECVSICPTGALVDNLKISKPAPWDLKQTATTCGLCDLGCEIGLNARGDLLVSASPCLGSEGSGSICVKGKYGVQLIQHPDRLAKPLVRKDGALTSTSWPVAVSAIVDRYNSLGLSGNECAVFVLGAYTNEELYLIKRFATEVLGTPHVASFGISEASGMPGLESTISVDEIPYAENILLFNVDWKQSPRIGQVMKEAMDNGARVMAVGGTPQTLEFCSDVIEVSPEQLLAVSRALGLVLAEEGTIDRSKLNEAGFAGNLGDGQIGSWQQVLRSAGVSERVFPKIRDVARAYCSRAKSVFICNLNGLPAEVGANLMAIMEASGKAIKLQQGILFLRGMANTIGQIAQINLVNPYDLVTKMREQQVRAAFIFGEDPVGTSSGNGGVIGAALKSLDLLVVQDMFISPTAALAHVVIPACSFAETEGTISVCDGRIRHLVPAVRPIPGIQNWQIIQDISNALGGHMRYASPEMIWMEMARSTPCYHGLEYPGHAADGADGVIHRGRLAGGFKSAPGGNPWGVNAEYNSSFEQKYIAEAFQKAQIRGYCPASKARPTQAAD